MNYLTAEEILAIHDRVIEETGGSFGLRDKHLLLSLVERPKSAFAGVEQYSTLFEKVASVFEAIARYHVFVDGNKRTAITSARLFLYLNGYKLTLEENEAFDFIQGVVAAGYKLEDIAKWLQKNSEKIS